MELTEEVVHAVKASVDVCNDLRKSLRLPLGTKLTEWDTIRSSREMSAESAWVCLGSRVDVDACVGVADLVWQDIAVAPAARSFGAHKRTHSSATDHSAMPRCIMGNTSPNAAQSTTVAVEIVGLAVRDLHDLQLYSFLKLTFGEATSSLATMPLTASTKS